MKINIPQDMTGTISGNAVYFIEKETWTFGSSDTARERVEWDSFTSVGISVAFEYSLKTKVDLIDVSVAKLFEGGEGRFGFSAKWRASFTDKGLELKPDGKQPKILGTNKSDGDIVVSVGADASQSDAGDKQPFVELTFVPVIGFEDDGIEVGLSFAGASAAKSVAKNKVSSSEQVTLRVYLIANRPAEKRPIAKIPAALLNPDPVYFECGEPTKDGLRALNGWVNQVKDHVQGALRTVILLGEVPIGLQAFSSPKGDKKQTAEMLTRIKKDLQSGRYFGSSRLKFDEGSIGKAREGKVEITLDKGKATAAIDKYLNG